LIKIAFRLDANNNIGTGHAVRCMALAETMSKHDCKCVFFCRENREIRDFTEGRNFNFIPVPLMEPVYEQEWMRDNLKDFDAVFIDSYFVNDEYIDRLNRPGFTVICYDDNALYKYSCDIVLNGNIYAQELSYKYGKKIPEMLIGSEYTLVRQEFQKVNPINVQNDAKTVLVCFGGSDARNFTPAALEALNMITNVDIIVILGAMTTCDKAVYSIINNKHTRVIKNPSSIAEVMSQCDIVISSAGSIVYELAIIGIPSITVIQAENQEVIANYLDKNGLMKCIGNWKTVKAEQIKNEVESLLYDADRRKRESEKLKKAVSRYGTENAANAIIKIIMRNK